MSDVVTHNGASTRRSRSASLGAALGRRSVVLVGMMGAGKSSVGRRLAARLGIPFVDADVEIEKAAGMTISEIFAAHGEPYFRAGETRVIARLLESGPQVLATGGGAFMNADTRAAIAPRESRCGCAPRSTSSIAGSSAAATGRCSRHADPAETLRRLIEERDPVYAEADLTVESRDVPHETIVDEILEGLRGRMAPDGARATEGTP